MRADELARENEALRDRLSKLSEASLRINENLEFETVLQGILDNALSLAEAQYGVITLLGESGQLRDFIASWLTPAESLGLWDLPDGTKFFEYLNSLSEPAEDPRLPGPHTVTGPYRY